MDRISSESRRAPPGWRSAPLIRVLAAQLIGAVVAFGAAIAVAVAWGWSGPVWGILAGQGLIAAGLGRRLFHLPQWWIPVQILLPPLAAAVAALAVPAWIYLALFAMLAAVYWNAARGRVPLYLSNRETWRAVAEMLPARPGIRFADLGSGIGGLLIHLARARPDAHFVGFESAPLPFAVSWLRLRLDRRPNLEIFYGDFWARDLAPFDVVYCFLSPPPMAAIHDKAGAEMESGAMLISNSFTIPGIPADREITVGDRRQTRLHVWRVGDATEE